ncbi:hypothetical protein B0A55_07629 [Friedmanniomyces simplex]|uniref:Uncharacterized protein n=1 Tax=Friedmanniomyces simplex TaxID=329884 RepID=A0A4U0X2H2_9PEZI|nr:hypothetical protein B0A55_07629 [Friedmanniomyces simplex]
MTHSRVSWSWSKHLEGIFNDKIKVSAADTQEFEQAAGPMLHIISQTQNLIRLWAMARGQTLGDASVVEDAHECYRKSMDAIEEWRAIARAMDARMAATKPQSAVLVQAHAGVHRYLGLLVGVTIILNCVVSVIDCECSATLCRDRTALILETLALVETVADYGGGDSVTRAAIEAALARHNSADWPAPETSRLISNLAFAARNFHQRLLPSSRAADF